MNDVEKGAEPVHLVQLSRQGCCQVEAKAIDMHVEHPAAKTVHDQLQDPRMAHVQCVSRSRIVHVITGIVGDGSVVDQVVDATKRKDGPELITLGSVEQRPE